MTVEDRLRKVAFRRLAYDDEKFALEHLHDLIASGADVAELKKAVLALAMRGRLVRQEPEEGTGADVVDEIRQLRKEQAGNAGLPFDVNGQAGPFEVPANWQWAKLSDIGDIVGGGTPRSSMPDAFTDDPTAGTPWFTPADLSGNARRYVSSGRRFLTEAGLSSCAARVIPKGGVLFSSRAPIGYVAILAEPGATNQGFKSLVPMTGVVSEYAYMWLRFRAPVIDANAPSTTFREVSGRIMQREMIAIPPTSEQKRIVEKSDEIFDLLRQLEQIFAT